MGTFHHRQINPVRSPDHWIARLSLVFRGNGEAQVRD
jgi:hypothetical protein